MTFLEHMREAVDRLAVFEELDVEPSQLPSSALRLSDGSVRDLLAETTGLAKQIAALQAVLAGVASVRSSRERGHGGLTQETGHRNAVEFIRNLTGATRGEATRAVRVGEALLDGAGAIGSDGVEVGRDLGSGAGGSSDGDMTGTDRDASAERKPWHQPLRDALLSGTITTAQHHAIGQGLGEPPVMAGRDADVVVDAWRAAAGELVREAGECTVEDLAARARSIKDMLDPNGAEERFAERFARRSYRWSTTTDGLRQAHITFDDEMGQWVRGMMDAAYSPRRGGPRFVAADQKAAADELMNDPRSNEQLAYDLFIDVLRAGALATAGDVYGTKEAGVRLVALTDAITGEPVRRDAFDRLVAVAHTEDGAITVPGSVLERAICTTGTVEVTVDSCGNPIDVGREARLFTTRQRLALAIRDGGCLWPGCDRPPAYCEAHHCDHWSDGGRTDCAVGVLLCRFHHLNLHNSGWRISRSADGHFLLQHPPGRTAEPIPLHSKSPLRWHFDPPPPRARWRAAA